MSDITLLLSKIEQGDQQALEQLLPMVYDELRRLAMSKMTSERPDHTLQATAVVHEAYLRLFKESEAVQWNSRAHFFAAAGEAMRRILVESARLKLRLKRGGQFKRQPLDEAAALVLPAPIEEIVAVGEALDKLDVEDPELAKLVKLRFFAGFTMPQVSEALGRPLRSVEREWFYARTWLHRELAMGREDERS